MRRPRWPVVRACFVLAVAAALALSTNARVLAHLAAAPLVGVFGDEFEADFGEHAAVTAGGQLNCHVIRAAERTESSVVLNGYLEGLVENAAPWVRVELVALWQRRPEEWAKLQVARALQELDVIRGGLLRFPQTSQSDAQSMLAARRAIDELVLQMKRRGETESCG